MPLMSGGDAVVRSLIAHGIASIYCLPGVQSDHLFNALFDAGDAIKAVHTRHEQGAAYMALGAALSAQGALAAGGHDETGNEAPDSVVILYGKVYPEVIRPSGKDATPAGTVVSTLAGAPTGTSGIVRRNEMESSNSNFAEGKK